MNVLITGGLGGLGAELARVFCEDPEMRVVTFSRRAGPAAPEGTPGAIHEQGSILDSDRLVEVMRRHEITHVIHAAGLRTRECEASLDLAREINVTGTERVLQAAGVSASVRRFLFLGSAAVYGRAVGLVDETRPVNPATNYALTKAEAENVVRTRAANARMDSVIVRPGFIFGARAEGGLSAFLRTVISGEAAHLVVPGHFHLHWAPGLCGDLRTLLRQPWPAPCRVYHLPGFDSGCVQFAAELRAALPVGSRVPEFHLEPDPLAPVPGRLDWKRFEQDFGPAKLAPFHEVLKLTLESMRNPSHAPRH